MPEADPVLAQEVDQPLLLVQLGIAQHSPLHDGDRHEAVALRLRVHRSVSKGDTFLLLGQIRSVILHHISPMNLVAVAYKLSSHGKGLLTVSTGEWQLVGV